MRVEGVVLLGVGVSLFAVACSGRSDSAGDDDGGKGGSAAGLGGQSGAAGSDAGRGGSAGRGGGAGDAGSAGTPPRGGASGSGGSAGMETGGTAAVGGSGAAGRETDPPTDYDPPGKGETWPITSGDPLNSTVPVLVGTDDGGVILAGASSDPATVGLPAFDDGILSEAFVARVDAGGKPVWRHPLLEAGLPWAMKRSGDDVVIVAAHLPDLAEVSTSYVSKDIYLAKVGLDGTIRYEKTITFENDDTYTYGLAVDSTGAIFLAGGVQNLDMDRGSISDPILVKCSPDGTKLWEKVLTHTGTQGYANAVTVLSSGDVVMTGAFDLEMTCGALSPIESTATLSGIPNGFIARYTTDGDPVFCDAFGGEDFSTGTALAALSGDDFLLAGSVAQDLNLGGKSLPGEPFVPSELEQVGPMAAFVARLSGSGSSKWVTLEKPATFAQAVDTNGGTVLLAGDMESAEAPASMAYLRSYATADGSAVQVVQAPSGTSIESASMAVGPGIVWVAGRFSGNADFGNENVVSAGAGVFLTRLRASP